MLRLMCSVAIKGKQTSLVKKKKRLLNIKNTDNINKNDAAQDTKDHLALRTFWFNGIFSHMSRVGTSAVELIDLVLSGLLVPDEPKPNTAAHLLGLVCCFWWKRSAGIVYTAEFTRVGSHYQQESGKN